MRRVFVTLCAGLMLVASCGGDEEPLAGAAEEGSPSSISTSTSLSSTSTSSPSSTSTSSPSSTSTSSPSSTSTSTSVVPSSTSTPVDTLEYATHAQEPLTLNMFVPAEPGDAPIVLHLLGGGGSGTSLVEPLVGEGAIVVVPRVARPTAGATTLLADHGAAAGAQADSIACAIRFARARAAELGSDDPVLILTSFSWGGGLAAHVALFGTDLEESWDEYAAEGGPQREVECVIPTGSTRVDALVAIGGAFDHFVPAWDGPAGKYGRSHQQERDPALWEFLYSSIGASPDLEVRLIHGTTDRITPPEMSAELAAVLTAAGYDVQFETFEGGHTLPVDLAVSTITEVLRP